MNCPNCGGVHLQRHSVIYQNGTSQVTLTHHGYNGDQYNTYGTHQTDLAAHCSPPRPPTPLPMMICIGLGGWMMYLGFHATQNINWSLEENGLVVFGIGLVLYKLWSSAANQYMEEKSSWQKSWFCHSCGNSYIFG